MASKIKKLDVPFTQVPNELLTDNQISLKAKGLWAYMQSKPNGWKFSAPRIAREIKESVNAIWTGLKELIEHGWLDREKQTDGTMVYTLKKPDCENPRMGKPKPISNKENISNKEKPTVKKNSIKHPSPNSRTDAQDGDQSARFLETLSNEVGNSEWWEAFCKAEKVLPSKRDEIIAQFSLHIKAEEKTHRNYTDFKNHFKSYLRKAEVRRSHKSFYLQPNTKRSEYNF